MADETKPALERRMTPTAFTPQHQAHFVYNTYMRVIEHGHTFRDLFRVGYWQHIAATKRLNRHDIIRVVGADGEFDVHIAVVKVVAGGIVMRFLFGDPGEGVDNPFEAAREMRVANATLQIVPLDANGKPLCCVEFLPATKWRVLGIDGKEVARKFETKDAALERLHVYLTEISMKLPDPDVKPAPDPKPSE